MGEGWARRSPAAIGRMERCPTPIFDRVAWVPAGIHFSPALLDEDERSLLIRRGSLRPPSYAPQAALRGRSAASGPSLTSWGTLRSFRLCRLNARGVIRKETLAGTYGNGRDAPIPVVRMAAGERVKSIQSRPSIFAVGAAFHVPMPSFGVVAAEIAFLCKASIRLPGYIFVRTDPAWRRHGLRVGVAPALAASLGYPRGCRPAVFSHSISKNHGTRR
jgi:hypothetical protein